MLPPIHNLLSFAVKCKLMLSRLHKDDNYTVNKLSSFLYVYCITAASVDLAFVNLYPITLKIFRFNL